MSFPCRGAVAACGALSLGAILSFAGVARAASAKPRGAAAELAKAISLFQNLDDEGAAAELNRLLVEQPSDAIAAKVHLYLGLIALNALDTDQARSQFEKALAIDPTVELPRRVSPKAKTVFGQARQKVASEAQAEEVPPAASVAPSPAAVPPALVVPVPEAAPPAAVTAPVATAPAPESRSHWLTWTLGGAAALAAAVAIYGGVDVLSYNSMIASAEKTPTNYTSSQIAGARSNAQVWSVGWLVAAGVGAACVTGAVLTW